MAAGTVEQRPAERASKNVVMGKLRNVAAQLKTDDFEYLLTLMKGDCMNCSKLAPGAAATLVVARESAAFGKGDNPAPSPARSAPPDAAETSDRNTVFCSFTINKSRRGT